MAIPTSNAFKPRIFTASLYYQEDEVFHLSPTDVEPPSDPTPTDDKKPSSRVTSPNSAETQSPSPKNLRSLKPSPKIEDFSTYITPTPSADEVRDKTVKKIANAIRNNSPETFQYVPQDELEIAVGTAFDKMKDFQQKNSVFPSATETKEFGIILKSQTKGYILTTSEHIAVGGNKEFFKGVKIVDKVGRCRVNSKAILLVKNVEDFKNRGFKVDPFNFESECILPKSEFKWETEDFIFFVKPLCKGDVFKISKAEKWDFDKCLNVMASCALALKACHDNKFIFRDVKPDNFYLFGDQVVIGDEDTVITEGEHIPQAGQVSTIGYTDFANKPSAATDMFAFGFCLIEMFKDKIPDLSRHILSRNRSPKLNPKQQDLVALIQALRSHKLEMRPSAQMTALQLENIANK